MLTLIKSPLSKLCLLGLGVAIGSTSHAEPQERNMINLQVEAQKEVQNDQIQAQLYTELTEVDPSKLAQKTNDIINKAMQQAKQYPSVVVNTGNQNTYPIYDKSNRKVISWRGRAEVVLTSTNVKNTSELIAKLQSDMQLGNVSFSVSPSQKAKVENELVIEATRLFRERASALQTAWGSSGYSLVNQNIQTSYNMPQPMYARAAKVMMADAAEVAPQEMQSGSTTMQIISSGTIQLK